MGRPVKRGFLPSLGYALTGLAHALRTQRNLRIQVALGVLALLGASVLGLGPLEWALLSAVITLVLTAELFNTALEAAVDVVEPDYHPRARVAKDVAAGAVLLTSIGALAVGAWLFLPRIWARLGLGS